MIAEPVLLLPPTVPVAALVPAVIDAALVGAMLAITLPVLLPPPPPTDCASNPSEFIPLVRIVALFLIVTAPPIVLLLPLLPPTPKDSAPRARPLSATNPYAPLPPP